MERMWYSSLIEYLFIVPDEVGNVIAIIIAIAFITTTFAR